MHPIGKRLFLVVVALAAALAATTWTFVLRDGHGGTGEDSSAGDNDFAALRARPLRQPRLVGQTCGAPQSFVAVGLPHEFPAEGALGVGPVHPVSRAIPRFLDFFRPPKGSPQARSGWWSNETMWVSEPRYSGPVLVRGGMVHGHARVGFGSRARPAWELHLPPGAWDEAKGPVRIWGKRVRPPKAWRARRAYTRVLAASGQGELCYFFQLDGRSFSQTALFGVIVQR